MLHTGHVGSVSALSVVRLGAFRVGVARPAQAVVITSRLI